MSLPLFCLTVGVVFLAGCVTEPRIMLQTEDQLVVDYDEILTRPDVPARMAEDHCAKRGKRPILTGQSGGGIGFKMLAFDCR